MSKTKRKGSKKNFKNKKKKQSIKKVNNKGNVSKKRKVEEVKSTESKAKVDNKKKVETKSTKGEVKVDSSKKVNVKTKSSQSNSVKTKNSQKKVNVSKVKKNKVRENKDVDKFSKVIEEVANEKEKVKAKKLKEKQKKNTANEQINIFKKASICALILVLVTVIIFILVRPKFKDIEIELGTTEVSVDNFLVSKIYKKFAKLETDLSEEDLHSVGEKEVTLSFLGKEQVVKLNVVDTTAPSVEFQDIMETYGYEVKAEDFLKSVSDESTITALVMENTTVKEDTEYKVKIKVSDEYGNYTTGDCTLKLGWIIPEVSIELGESLSLKDIVLDVDKFGKYVSKEELDNVDTDKIGTYKISATYNDEVYTSTITVQDTTAPTLKLKALSIYDDQTSLDYKKFISKVSDADSYTTSLKTEITFGKVGKQTITIEAVDASGNKTTKETTLTISKDTTGPVFYGLTAKSIKKNASVNYKSGVKAVDAKDGSVEFTVDYSKVKTSTAGTYYVTYKAKDKSGNVTTRKRKITVLHDSSDTQKKFNEFYNSYLAGKSVEGMAKEIWNRIAGTSDTGGSDPVWYGLTNGKGNCIVHAKILEMALDKAGYENMIIYRTDKAHYWNLVKVNGVWRHIDSSPKYNTSLQTDKQKLAQPELKGGDWDHDKFPAAE